MSWPMQSSDRRELGRYLLLKGNGAHTGPSGTAEMEKIYRVVEMPGAGWGQHDRSKIRKINAHEDRTYSA